MGEFIPKQHWSLLSTSSASKWLNGAETETYRQLRGNILIIVLNWRVRFVTTPPAVDTILGSSNCGLQIQEAFDWALIGVPHQLSHQPAQCR